MEGRPGTSMKISLDRLTGAGGIKLLGGGIKEKFPFLFLLIKKTSFGKEKPKYGKLTFSTRLQPFPSHISRQNKLTTSKDVLLVCV